MPITRSQAPLIIATAEVDDDNLITVKIYRNPGTLTPREALAFAAELTDTAKEAIKYASEKAAS